LFDVAALRVGEFEPFDESARFRRIVVLDRGLEMLAKRRRLAKLATEPAEQADLSGLHMGGDGIEPPIPCV
jgi:hypothetical protein